MKWNGEMLKALCEKQGIAKTKLAKMMSVSRPTVYSWFSNKVPKGHHLLTLCELLDVAPAVLFHEEVSPVTVPVHRARSNAKITDERRRVSQKLAEEFAPVFGDVKNTEVLSVIRTTGFDEENVRQAAQQLRNLAEIPEKEPCTYKHAFNLLQKLGCYVVFQSFPSEIKSYAFYSEVYGHRVVFVNRKSNILDLVFFLLHEAVHAAFDEQKEISDDLENFCDAVAGAIQFPSEYLHLVKNLLSDLNAPQQRTLLKKLAKENGHATYGLTKQLFPKDKTRHSAAGKADNYLRRGAPTIDKLFFEKNESAHFLSIYRHLSPQYYQLITSKAPHLSVRRIGELMGLESELDAVQVKEKLMCAES